MSIRRACITLMGPALVACAMSSATAHDSVETPPPAAASPVATTAPVTVAPRRTEAKPATTRVREGTAVVYVSAFCMHCKPVLDQLREEGIPFVKRDILDPRHRDEYAEKMRSIGRQPPAVPLVDLHGRLVLGLDNLSISTLAAAHRSGRTPLPEQEWPGATTPPTPRKPVHEPGDTALLEPPDGVATLYVSSEFCPHCGPARKFLRARGIRFIERDIVNPRSAEQLMNLHLTFHQRGHTVPSLEVHGRGLIGFDHDGIDLILGWRRAARR